MSTGRWKFGDFEFDPDSGELSRGKEPACEQRLPPQPARLLALLLERNGELVSREEIRALLWPGIQVEFDTSLHFCIRQIRSALGDSAASARYIETLPRRGYRILTEATRTPDSGSGSVASATDETPRRRLPWVGLGLLALLAAGTAALIRDLPSRPAVETRPRIAIMPFRPPAGSDTWGEVGPIAEWILEELTRRAGSRAEVLGPTSTEAWDNRDETLAEIQASLRLDYLINSRFLGGEKGSRMLAELIRAGDGAHIWVQSYEDLSDGRRIGLDIAGAVSRSLGLERPPGDP